MVLAERKKLFIKFQQKEQHIGKKKNASETYIYGKKQLKYGPSRKDKGFHLIRENFNNMHCIWEWRKIKITEVEGCEVSYKYIVQYRARTLVLPIRRKQGVY